MATGHETVVSSLGAGRPRATSLKCTPLLKGPKREYNVEEAVKDNFRRYDALRRIMLRKADAASIKNLNTNSKVTVVGMVREKKDFGFVLEDSTGVLAVKSSASADAGDVLGVSGWLRNGVFAAEDVMYPDVPMNRNIPIFSGTVIFRTERSITDKRADITVTPDSFTVNGNETMTTQPNALKLEKEGKSVVVYMFSNNGPVSRDDAVKWLRRRYIPSQSLQRSDYVLEPLPDILCIVGSNDVWTENYKGTTIVSFSPGKCVLLDLKTRAASQC